MTLKGQNDEQAYTLDELFMEKAKYAFEGFQ
jgi:hypothetical protein